MRDNLGIGIANAAWVATIGAIIIFAHASLWLLVVPIIFNWKFITPSTPKRSEKV